MVRSVGFLYQKSWKNPTDFFQKSKFDPNFGSKSVKKSFQNRRRAEKRPKFGSNFAKVPTFDVWDKRFSVFAKTRWLRGPTGLNHIYSESTWKNTSFGIVFMRIGHLLENSAKKIGGVFWAKTMQKRPLTDHPTFSQKGFAGLMPTFPIRKVRSVKIFWT